MNEEIRTLVNMKTMVIVLLAILLAVLPLSADQAYAEDDETSMEAQVEVVPVTPLSYGAVVVGMRHTLFSVWALREPDNRTAYILWKGEISIKLENMVKDTDMISVWAAGGGWPYSNMKVYVSENGRNWTRVDNLRVRYPYVKKYDIAGNFGDVRYIKVEQIGGRWTYVRLDAVCAKGGDTSGDNWFKPRKR